MNFEDTASAAEAAAESAKKAIAAAGAAAYLANRDSYQVNQASDFHNSLNGSNSNADMHTISGNNKFFPKETMSSQSKVSSGIKTQSSESSHYVRSEESLPKDMDSRKIYRRHSYNVAPSAHSDDESEYDEEIDVEYPTSGAYQPPKRDSDKEPRKTYRRHSYNVQSTHADIKFDESDCDEDFERDEPSRGKNLPPNRPAPEVPSAHVKSTTHRVHPKLPDYDALAARFEALKHRKA